MKLTYTETTLGIPPKSPSAGQFWYDEQNKVAGVWDEYERRWVKFSVIEHDHDGAYARGGFTHLSKRGIIVNKEDKYLNKILSNIRDASSTNPYTVFLGPGEYLISGLITVPDYVNIVGTDKDHSVFYSNNTNVSTMFELGVDSTLSNLTINHYGTFAGTADLICPTAASTYVTLENLNINVDFTSNSDVVVDLITYSGTHIDIIGCTFNNSEDANSGTAISIGNQFSDVLILNNIFRYFGEGIVDTSSAADNKIITKNYFYNCEIAVLAADTCLYIRTNNNICEDCTHDYVCTSVGTTWSTRLDVGTWELDASTIVDSVIYVDTIGAIKDRILFIDDVTISGVLTIPVGAGLDYVFRSDASGVGSWEPLTAAAPLHWNGLALDIGGLSSYGNEGQVIAVAAGGTSLEWTTPAVGVSLTFSEPLIKDIGNDVSIGGLDGYGIPGQAMRVAAGGTSLEWFDVITSGITTSPGGSDTQIQYNDGGIFAGDSKLTWTKGTSLLAVNGSLGITTSSIPITTYDGVNPVHYIGYAGTNGDYLSFPRGATIGANIDFWNYRSIGTGTAYQLRIATKPSGNTWTDRLTFSGNVDIATVKVTNAYLETDNSVGINMAPVSTVSLVVDAASTDNWVRVANFLNSSQQTGEMTALGFGVTDSAHNIAGLAFKYVGAGSTSNEIWLQFHSGSYLGMSSNGALTMYSLARSANSLVLNTDGDLTTLGDIDTQTSVYKLNNTLGISGQVMAVNGGGTALEWVTISGGTGTTTLDKIIDIDSDTYVDTASNILQFNAGGQDVTTMSSALVTVKKDLDLITKVIKLNGAFGTDGQVLAVNSAETELEWVTISGGGVTTLDKIVDADGDTKVLTEITPDDDCVRIYAAGVEVAAAASTKFQVIKTLDVSSNVIQLNNTFGTPGQVMAVDDAGTALEWTTISGGSSPSSGNITISGQNGVVVTNTVVGDTTNYVVSLSGVFFSLNFDCTLDYSPDVYIKVIDDVDFVILGSGIISCMGDVADIVSGIDTVITSSYSWS
ncbi:MAG TPA: hypothetical protein PKN48_00690 [Bacteroidales bacterium]|nr:hypothetical protein [Bacteroidales bacterium]